MPEKVVYTGHFVKDQKKLLAQLPPAITSPGSTIYAHHVTREFAPKNGIEDVTLGRKRIMHIIGHVIAGRIHAALVRSSDGENITTKAHAHITMAAAEGIPPVKSDTVIAQAIENGTVIPIHPPIEVETVEGYFDGEQVHTS